ncbi:MAG: hypothetical protein ACI9T7_002804 [Oleiphilaceae bacterium]|jgi:hypothetical protein
MKYLRITLMVVAILSLVACARQQTISIETSPPGAAISVDQEYIGRSPVDHDIDDTRKISKIKIVAEKVNYNAASKTIKKLKNKERFPNAVFLKLDQVAPLLGANGSGQGGQQQGGQQTTIQGPTIVFPGMTGSPQVISPVPQ